MIRRSRHNRSGSALIIALWVILILSLLIGAFAFDMHIEAGIASYYRKRLKAEYLARAGIEEAMMLLSTYEEEQEEDAVFADTEDDNSEAAQARERIQNGVQINTTRELGAGKFEFTIYPAESRRNVNKLDEEDWQDLLERSGITDQAMIEELIDCFFDWVDKGVEHRLNGAEEDDSFYEEMEYVPKNAPLDTVDELLLIKGFTPAILYGGMLDEDSGEEVTGIANILTAWGGGKVNPNSATPETLRSLDLTDEQIEAIQVYLSEEPADGSTEFPYFESVEDFLDIAGLPGDMAEFFAIKESKYYRVSSIGTVGEGRSVSRAITCIVKVHKDEGAKPVYWIEEHMP